ncbi:MAG: DUF2065 domain-containing protein [Nitrosomonas sp.]|nr:DUF2065 domain-containing protein [Nitrosomonas sp.]
MLETFLMAFALMLIIEGILPFISPRMWREAFIKMTELDDGQLRFIGLTSMIIGLALLMLFS